MTPTATGLIEKLQARADYFEHRLETATDSFERGIHTGWRAATEEAIRDVQAALADIEAEAFLLPETEEVAA